jgi:hypothetical protein
MSHTNYNLHNEKKNTCTNQLFKLQRKTIAKMVILIGLLNNKSYSSYFILNLTKGFTNLCLIFNFFQIFKMIVSKVVDYKVGRFFNPHYFLKSSSQNPPSLLFLFNFVFIF